MIDEERFQYVNENNEIEWLTADEFGARELEAKQKSVN